MNTRELMIELIDHVPESAQSIVILEIVKHIDVNTLPIRTVHETLRTIGFDLIGFPPVAS